MNTSPSTVYTERPNKDLIHSMVVTRIEDRAKEFKSTRMGCQVRSYIVHFDTGYCAEVLFPVGQKPSGFNNPPNKTSFRIGYRNEPKLDEIEFLPDTPTKVLSMSGHPASIALLAACNLLQGSGVTASEVVEYADTFAEFLIERYH